MKLSFFTSITNSYFSKARILARSVKSVYPESEFVVALLDRQYQDLTSIEDSIDRVFVLGEEHVENFNQWIYFHDVVEACTAQKGLVIEKLLLEGTSDAVVYLDPDIKVFSRLVELEECLSRSSVVLTPHLTEPSRTDAGVQDNELAASIHGTYNLGFLALRNSEQGRAVAKWWKDRLLRYCFDEKERGIFTDQKWFDLVPALFDEVLVLRHPGYNIATWNIENRMISREDDQLKVNDEDVRFIHFSGYDSGAHKQMLDLYAANQPEFRALSLEYSEELEALRFPAIDDKEWIYKRNSIGEVIQRDWRRRFRDDATLRGAYSDPFKISGAALRRQDEVDPLSRAVISGSSTREILERFETYRKSSLIAQCDSVDRVSEAQLKIAGALPSGRPTLGFVSHGLGGGVEVHIAELMPIVTPYCNTVVLSVQRKQDGLWALRVSVHGSSGVLLNETLVSDIHTLVDVIDGIGCTHFHVHSIFSEESFWLAYFSTSSTPYDVTIHDYALLTDNWSMDNGSGGTLPLEEQNEELMRIKDYPHRFGAVQAFLDKASRVIFPSESARDRFSMIIQVKNPIVAYHPEFPPPELVERHTFSRPSVRHVMRVGIVGDLASHKGLKQITEFIKFGLRNEFRFEVHHFGAPYPTLRGEVIDHGPYRRNELPSRVSMASIDLIWLPSQVHETYGYAVSDALMTGLPIVASGVGAYPERLLGLDMVSILPPDAETELVWAVVRRLIFEGESVWFGPQPSSRSSHLISRSFYPTSYLEVISESSVA